MGNITSKRTYKNSSKTIDEQWIHTIKKQLTQNCQLYLSYEIYDEMTYNNNMTEISKQKLLNILKFTLDELHLNYFITISRTRKPIHYFIDVSIINNTNLGYIKQPISRKKTILLNDDNSISSNPNTNTDIQTVEAQPELTNVYPVHYGYPQMPLYPPSPYPSFYYPPTATNA